MKVLIIDDEELILEFISEIIESEFSDNCDITLCLDGLDAWDKVQNNEFDLIISDYQLPGLDGLKILTNIETLKRKSPPFCIMSGALPPQMSKVSYSNRLFALNKPFQLTDIVEVCERVQTDNC